MIDSAKHRPLRVLTDGGAGPYIVAPADQLDKIAAILDANKVSYWVDEEVLSIDGKPEVGFINLALRTDPVVIQRLLDKCLEHPEVTASAIARANLGHVCHSPTCP